MVFNAYIFICMISINSIGKNILTIFMNRYGRKKLFPLIHIDENFDKGAKNIGSESDLSEHKIAYCESFFKQECLIVVLYFLVVLGFLFESQRQRIVCGFRVGLSLKWEMENPGIRESGNQRIEESCNRDIGESGNWGTGGCRIRGPGNREIGKSEK